MTQLVSSIEQLNLGYNRHEDRLLMRIGMRDQSEMSLWISRRICKVIWSQLQTIKDGSTPIYQPSFIDPSAAPQVADTTNKAQMLASFAQEASSQKAIENMDFNSAYIADRQPITEAPLLIAECTLETPQDKAAYFSLQCTNMQTVKMALSNELIFALSNMLQLSTREAGWDLKMEYTQPETIPLMTQQVLH